MNLQYQLNLFGLVLVGGKSTRMGQTKALLNYYGRSQSEYSFELLGKFCEKVFISNCRDQAQIFGENSLPQIFDDDAYKGIGPLGGILSAMKDYPSRNWLVLACDLPFVSEGTLTLLLKNRNQKKIATVFISEHDQLPEPLCAIYESKAQKIFLEFVKKGIYCPRKILMQSDVQLIELNEKHALDNVNNPEEYQKVLTFLKHK